MLDATPLLRAYARFRRGRLQRMDPVKTQARTLAGLIRRARDTRFGRDHGFAHIRNVEAFRDRVPLRTYEDFWEAYWQAPFPRIADITWPGTVPYFAVTSGTTSGRTKYIPCTHAMNRSNRRAAIDILVHHVANQPGSRLLGGRNFMLGGSTALKEEAPGIHSGDLSGIAAAGVPWWARPRYFPPPELGMIEDWEEKVDRLARAALGVDIRTIGGTPSWVLIFLDRLAEIAGSDRHRLADHWPDFELYVHGGVNFAPYRSSFAGWLEGSRAETREVYAASEGFVAIADRGPDEGMRLNLDIGLFYEFVPLAELDADRPTRHWAADAETGVEYALVVTTCAGAWAYVLGDTVRLVDRDPPRVLITGRTSYQLSAFGEHLIDSEIEEAVSAAAEAIGAAVTDFAVAPIFPDRPGALGGHHYLVEFADHPPGEAEAATFADVLDRTLAETNDDYRDHRSGGYGLDAPRIDVLAPGTFAAWMKARGQLGGQHKVPRIVNDASLFAALKAFALNGDGAAPT